MTLQIKAPRPRIPFRSVNRRGTPGHDPGLQRHHLLPRQLLTRPALRAMLEGVGRQRIGFDDFRANGMLLPAREEGALRTNLPLHRGPHRQYNDMVIERVGQIELGWSRTCRTCSDRAGREAVMRLKLLQSALRRRLLGAMGRRLMLNRRDPGGRPVDFSDLDAMVESLWGATAPATRAEHAARAISLQAMPEADLLSGQAPVLREPVPPIPVQAD